jgi:hypothetical protein
MITICLLAYLTLTCLFVAGLAVAAGRPTPEVPAIQILQQEPVASVTMEKAA